jgi:hypothetical protein
MCRSGRSNKISAFCSITRRMFSIFKLISIIKHECNRQGSPSDKASFCLIDINLFIFDKLNSSYTSIIASGRRHTDREIGSGHKVKSECTSLGILSFFALSRGRTSLLGSIKLMHFTAALHSFLTYSPCAHQAQLS